MPKATALVDYLLAKKAVKTRAQFNELIKRHAIRVNFKPCSADTIVIPGDVVEVGQRKHPFLVGKPWGDKPKAPAEGQKPPLTERQHLLLQDARQSIRTLENTLTILHQTFGGTRHEFVQTSELLHQLKDKLLRLEAEHTSFPNVWMSAKTYLPEK